MHGLRMNAEQVFFDGWPVLLRTAVVGVLAYSILIVFLRATGKRTLSKMNAFDFVVTVALGSTLASILLSRTRSTRRPDPWGIAFSRNRMTIAAVPASTQMILLQTLIVAEDGGDRGQSRQQPVQPADDHQDGGDDKDRFHDWLRHDGRS